MDPLSAATAEIVRLHDFIVGWFRGEIARERFDSEFAAVLHPDFETVQPSGKVLTRAGLVEPIRAAHGANSGFGITIDRPRLIATLPGHILAGYVEAQTGARNSAPANRRRSTVLFQTGPRLLWRHLHETGLPDAENG